jgi:3-deoxy-D-manno-octulosonate 8-phosphate phosphatase (KDO 8-P phosphatase)
MSIEARAARVRLLLFDVDGVFTDGSIVLHGDGSESKVFSVRDGTAIVFARRAGLTTGLVSARTSAATAQRAAQLAIPIVEQSGLDKLTVYERIREQEGLSDAEVAYMGDDLLDLPVLARVGLAACPADAAPEVRDRVHWISRAGGGRGAVREIVELVLRARGQWAAIVNGYLEGPAP